MVKSEGKRMRRFNRRWLFVALGAAIFVIAGWLVPLPTFGHCGVHGEMLWNGSVSVGYGLEAYSLDLRAAELNEFPHARDYAGGGCILPPVWSRILARITARATYCRSCVRARDRWASEHLGWAERP
jgi:hypothetical protein